MSRLFKLIGVLMLLIIVPCVARAESNWQFPNLNPFAKKSDAAAESEKSSRFKMPTLLPSFGEKSNRRSSEPSTWNKLTTGTKEFLGKTADVLTPWDTAAEKKARNSSVSDRFPSRNYREKEVEKKESIFTSWLPEKKEPERPRSVSEFLKQPRPSR
jgi:hypothetical protein